MKKDYSKYPEPIRAHHWITTNWPMEGEGEVVNLFTVPREELINLLIQERQARYDLLWFRSSQGFQHPSART